MAPLDDFQLHRIWDWNAKLPPIVESCVHEAFSQQAQSRPSAIAISAWDGELTYDDLEKRSTCISLKLARLGVGPNVIVPLCFEKSMWAVVAMLGVLKAGGTIVLLDTSLPEKRLLSITEQCKAKVACASYGTQELCGRLVETVVTVGPVGELETELSIGAHTCNVSPSSPMYVCFTSGSTGTPKGVVMSHSSFYTACDNQLKLLGFNSESRVFDFASYSFDVSIINTFGTLISGGCLCIPSEHDRRNRLNDALRETHATIVNVTPTVARLLDPATLPKLQTIILLGEPVNLSDLERLWGEVRIINSYGATECAVMATINSTAQDPKAALSVGRGFGVLTWIVDEDDHEKLVPVGTVGELLLEGRPISQGYLGDPEKTSAAFVQDPAWLLRGARGYAGRSGRLYKTGDLVRYNADGSLSYVGRKDTQVKIRGQRVELGEIEYHLQMCFDPAQETIVEMIRPRSQDNKSILAAFMVVQSLEESSTGVPYQTLPVDEGIYLAHMDLSLRERLLQRLPGHMIPSVYFFVDKLPRTASGKTDRKCLRQIGSRLSLQQIAKWNTADSGMKSEPRTNLESRLRCLWANVLNIEVDDIGIHDTFFKLGGDSIAAMKIVELAKKQGLRLSVAEILLNPVLAAQSALINDYSKEQEAEIETEIKPFCLLDFDGSGSELRTDLAALCSVPPSLIEDAYPCTALQQGLLSLTVKGSDGYVSHVVMQIPPGAGTSSLQNAWEETVRANDILRTRIVDHPQLGFVQAVCKNDAMWGWAESTSKYLEQLDLSTINMGQPLSRFALIGNTPKDPESIIWTVHHSIFDGHTLDLIYDEVRKRYAGKTVDERPKYNKFIESVVRSDHEDSKRFWHSYINEDFIQFPALPTSVQEVAADTVLERSLGFYKNADATASTLLRAALTILIYQHTGSETVCFGTVASGRGTNLSGIEKITGPTIATVPISVKLQMNQEVSEYLQTLQQSSAEMIKHEQIGLQNIAKMGDKEKAACEFQTLLVVQPQGASTIDDADQLVNMQTLTPERPSGTYALAFECNLAVDRINVKAYFDNRVLNQWQVERMLEQLDSILSRMSNPPTGQTIAQMNDITHQDKETIWSWNDDLKSVVDSCIHTLIEKQVGMQPFATAISSWDGHLTYDELNKLSTKLAFELTNLGVGPEAIVPLFFEKSMWTVVAMIGVLKAGGAFLSLDPAQSEDYLRFVLKKTKAHVVLSSASFCNLSVYESCMPVVVSAASLQGMCTPHSSLPNISPSTAAYVIFTSGSTGQPKGVVVEHKSLSTSCSSHGQLLGMGPSTRLIEFASYTFDACLFEIFTTLSHGGSIIIPSEKQRLGDLSSIINSKSVNFAGITPTLARLIKPQDVPTLKTLILGGEASTKDDWEQWKHLPNFFNGYGPTEATIVSVISRCTETSVAQGSIGTGVGCLTWVVDCEDHTRLAPLGAVGELLIEGPVLSRGYLDEPDKTAAAFIEDPPWLLKGSQTHPGRRGRLYKTGDLVRYNENGSLTYISRKDTQVKIRGQRVELGEIEHHARECLSLVGPAVAEVVRFSSQETRPTLVLFTEACPQNGKDDENSFTTSAVGENIDFMHVSAKTEALLAERLPRHMIPTIFLRLAKIPVTKSDKIDRKGLRQLATQVSADKLIDLKASTANQQPQTEAETRLRTLWSQILGIDAAQISTTDNFFRLGGDSITAMKLAGVGGKAGISLSVSNVFRYPTLQEQALTVSNMTKETSEKIAPFSLFDPADTSEELTDELARLCGIEFSLIEDAYPCTALQEGLLSLTDKGASNYETRVTIQVPKGIDPSSLQTAWEKTVQEVETLRTRIVHHPKLGFVQVVLRDGAIRWNNSSSLSKYLEMDKLVLTKLGGPLSRFAAVNDAKSGNHFLVWSVHHSVYDGHSLPIIFDLVKANYQGEDLHERPSYNKFVQYIANKDKANSETFWRSYLKDAGFAPFPSLPRSIQEPSADSIIEYNLIRKDVRTESTTSTLLRGALAILIGQHTNSTDILYGAVVSGRNSFLPGIEGIVGPTIATVPVRIRLNKEQNVGEYLKAVQQDATEIIAHEQTGLQNIAKMGEEGRVACSFQTLLVVNHEDTSPVQDDIIKPVHIVSKDDVVSTYALTLECFVSSEGIYIRAHFDPRILNKWKLEKMLAQFRNVFEQLTMDRPDQTLAQINSLTIHDRETIWTWNSALDPAVELCAHEAIEKHIQARPESIAVSAWDGELTYGQLGHLSTELAHQLVKFNIGPDKVVPLYFEKSMWAVVAVLGVLKSGGAFMFMNHGQATDRQKRILHRAAAHIILTSDALSGIPSVLGYQGLVVSHESLAALSSGTRSLCIPSPEPNALAYVIFTSGSTGEPKGVAVEHRSITTNSYTYGSCYNITSSSRVFQFSSYIFDGCIWEILLTLINGATILVPSEDQRMNALETTISTMKATAMFMTPTVARTIQCASMPTLQTLIMGGESVLGDDLEAYKEIPKLFVVYGPSEATVFATNYRYNPRTHVQGIIGQAVGCSTWVVDKDDHGQLAPIGAIGELLIEGSTVARGYINDPERTANSFILDPPWLLQGCQGRSVGRRGRLYKTGDLVQYDKDGNLLFVGRKDDQVKIRGQRLELGEVEHHLRECVPSAREILAEVIRPVGPGSKPMLAAFVVENEFDLAISRTSKLEGDLQLIHMHPEVDAALAQLLPEYMIPTLFFAMREVPLLPSGKTNRKRLREIGSKISLEQLAKLQTVSGQAKQQPQTEMEMRLRDLWADALNIDPCSIGINDSFFRLGGDSITAMKLSSAARSLDFRLRVADIFQARTLSQLAKRLTSSQSVSLQAPKRSSQGPFCLSPVQKLHFATQPMVNVCFDQCFLLELQHSVSPTDLTLALRQVIKRHASLRYHFKMDQSGAWNQVVAQEDGDFFNLPTIYATDDHYNSSLIRRCRDTLDIENGPVVAGLLFDINGLQSLFLTIHHLVVDLVSWRIILRDLEALLLSKSLGVAHSIDFGDWCVQQDEYAQQHLNPRVQHPVDVKPSILSYWGMDGRENNMGNVTTIDFKLDKVMTTTLFGDANQSLQTRPVEIMLGVLVHSFHFIFKDRDIPAIFCEAHGREPWSAELDVTDTVGWFTTMFPIQLQSLDVDDVLQAIICTKDSNRSVVSNGWPYFTSQFQSEESSEAFCQSFPVEILFNYEGMYQQMEKSDSIFKFLPLPRDIDGKTTGQVSRLALFDINVGVSNGQACVTFAYDRHIRHQDRIMEWVKHFQYKLEEISQSLEQMNRQWTLTDFPGMFETYQDLLKFQEETVKQLGIAPENVQDIFACSPMQEALLIHQIKDPESYMPIFLSEIVPGSGQLPVDVLRLERAWKDVVQKHTLMRTILIDGLPGRPRPAHIVLRTVEPSLSHHHLSDEILDIKTARKHFKPVMFQNRSLQHHLAIFKLNNGRIVCCLQISHVLIDAHSRSILLRDLVAAYNDNLDNAEISYHDFITHTEGMSSEDAGEYWSQYIEEVEPCHVPTTPSLRSSESLWMKEASVTGVDMGKVKEFCTTHGITIATLVSAAWGAVLGLYTSVGTPCFGLLLSGRDLPVAEIDNTVGPTISIIATKLIQDGMDAIDSLHRLQEDYANGLPHQFYSLARIQHAQGFGSTLFNTAVSVESERPLSSQPDNSISVLDIEGYDPNEFAITVHANICASALDIVLTYQSDKIQHDMAVQLAEAMSKAMTEIMSHPTKEIKNLDLISDKDRSFIWSWNKTVPHAVEECCHDLISQRARAQPDEIAVYAWDGELSYMELDKLSNRLAHHLIGLGVGLETIVPLCFEKSVWMMVAVLGVLKAGGAYVALDPKQANSRQQTILEKVKAQLILVSASFKNTCLSSNCAIQVVDQESLDALFSPDEPLPLPNSTSPSASAYLIFTSGSTGQPKGVMIDHRAVSTASHHHGLLFGLRRGSRVFQFTSYTFDICIVETIGTLIHGGTIIVPSEDQRLNKLSSTMTTMGANTAFLTPTVSRTLRPNEVPTLTKLILGGEKFLIDDWTQWKHLPYVFNSYGPTETTVFCTSKQLIGTMEEGHIGLPFGCLAWIVDRDNHQRLVPMGHVGELLLEGPLLSKGYLDAQEKTAAVFIEDPDWLIQGAKDYQGRRGRVYKTGDLVQYKTDGSLKIIGRKDTQVKVRGHRVELGDIEHHLCELLPVNRVVAEVIQLINHDNKPTLAAFMEQDEKQRHNGDRISAVSLIQEGVELVRLSDDMSITLAQHLPAYMIPSLFFRMSKMPQTRYGRKTNRELLREIGSMLSSRHMASFHTMINSAKSQPQTEAEQRVRDLWVEVLNIDSVDIGIDDSFFHLGGDSIAAMKLVGEANRQGLALSVTDVFLKPTLASLAACLSIDSQRTTEPVDRFSLLDSHTKAGVIRSAEAFLSQTSIEDIYPVTSFQQNCISQTMKYPTQNYNYVFLDLDFQPDEVLLTESYHRLLGSYKILRAIPIHAQNQHWLAISSQLTPQILIQDTMQDLEEFSNRFCAKDIEGILPLGEPFTSLTLVRYQSKQSRLILRLSHAQYDGVCMPNILKALLDLYFGQPIPNPPDFTSYLKHTRDQRQSSLAYWREILSGSQMTRLLYETKFPILDKPQSILIDDEIILPPLPQGVTLASVMSASWAVTLSLVTGKDDVVYGGLVAGRNATIPHIGDIIGPCVNYIPIRARLDTDQSPLQLFLSLHNQNASLGQADSVGFEDVVRNSTNWSDDTTFDTIIQHQNVSEKPRFEIEGARIKSSYYVDPSHIQFRGTYMISYPCKDSVTTRILTNNNIMNEENAKGLSTILHCSIIDLLTHLHEPLRLCKERIYAASGLHSAD